MKKQMLKQFYKGNKVYFGLALLGALLEPVLSLWVSVLIQQLMDATMSYEGVDVLLHPAMMMIALLFVLVFVCFLQYISMPRFLSRAMRQYKDFVFKELTKKSISAFHGENTATYISALSNDANVIEQNYLENIFKLIENSIMFVGAFVLMLYYSPLLTLAAFVLSFLPVIASLLAGNRLAVQEKKVSERNESFVATLKDALSGFSVVKSFQAEKAIYGLFSQSNQSVEETKCTRNKITVFIQAIGAATGATAQLGVFLIGAYLALTGKGVTPGIVIAFVNLMNFVIQPIATVPGILASRKAAKALMDKLSKALASNVREEGIAVSDKKNCDISINNLSFAYEEEKQILKNITTRFETGKSYAIVGASGSGKSTLLNLLMAGNNNYAGEICFGDVELREISSESLYEMVSIIQQNVFVFNSSIRDNITMFHTFEKSEVDHAIKLSGLDALITERGEDYLCGENGNVLSGGEKQRISIARCLLRKTPVLLVDEATAALDAETAFHVTSAILGLEDLTRIVVTHTLDEGLLKRYDSILTLKNGRIVETGSFEELMEQKGYFYSLYTVSQD